MTTSINCSIKFKRREKWGKKIDSIFNCIQLIRSKSIEIEQKTRNYRKFIGKNVLNVLLILTSLTWSMMNRFFSFFSRFFVLFMVSSNWKKISIFDRENTMFSQKMAKRSQFMWIDWAEWQNYRKRKWKKMCSKCRKTEPLPRSDYFIGVKKRKRKNTNRGKAIGWKWFWLDRLITEPSIISF